MPDGEEKVISTGEFVSRLFELKSKKLPAQPQIPLPQLLPYGHFRGWLEDSDQRHPEAPLNRQTAARIIHTFLLIELQLPDLQDISPATKLKDLYTCRVCANHIAQVYSREIMGADEELYFNHLELITEKEIKKVIANCEAVKQSI